MIVSLPRTDPSVLGRWWWTVDRWTLVTLLLLIGFGGVLTLTASPPVAERLGLDSFSLARRHLLILPLVAATLIAVSLATPRAVRLLAILGLFASLVLLVLVLFLGAEIKGATRWIALGGISLQPSELVKPCFVVVTARLLSEGAVRPGFPGGLLSVGLWGLVVALLLLQPDLGQAVVVSLLMGIQLFLAGLPIILVVTLALCGIAGLFAAYHSLPHVARRIDSFLDPGAGDRYQIARSLEAFQSGGIFGRGPGEGTVKQWLPDSHSDFVFAVVGEEMGMIVCLLIAGAFAFLVLRGFWRLLGEESLFVLLAATGLLAQLGLQALINMGSALHLMPTKGMTLPFVSYGGSSLLGLALGMGMLLALTRRRTQSEVRP